ncbi:hypothetical protein GCM10027440_10250 [Nocardiopsis coralliicola]
MLLIGAAVCTFLSISARERHLMSESDLPDSENERGSARPETGIGGAAVSVPELGLGAEPGQGAAQ